MNQALRRNPSPHGFIPTKPHAKRKFETVKPQKTPSELGPAGKRFWKRITSAFVVVDAASYEFLFLACVARDRLAAAEAAIREDGGFLKDRFGQTRAHPAVQISRDATATMLAAMRALGLHELPADRGGRPPGSKA
jgi:phage terminase small subunit